MQPYVNPNLFLSPIYGNYMQNPMPQAQPVGISGKYVNDFGEINASDIPMSGPAVFAKNDRSEIQIREWNPNGQIVTTSYKAVVETQPMIEKDILDRDYRDMNRDVSPLKQAEDAVLLDSSDMTVDEVVSTVVDMVKEKEI